MSFQAELNGGQPHQISNGYAVFPLVKGEDWEQLFLAIMLTDCLDQIRDE